MSATNRGAARVDHDVYETPPWCVRALFADPRWVTPPGTRWLEPSAGSGSCITTVDHVAPDPARTWTAVELRPEARDDLRRTGALVVTGDYLTAPPMGQFDVAFGNPPYLDAEAHVRRALGESAHVVFLLRLGFLASARRLALHTGITPDVWSLARRPSFRADGRTDATDYAWFHWDVAAGATQAHGRVFVVGGGPND